MNIWIVSLFYYNSEKVIVNEVLCFKYESCDSEAEVEIISVLDTSPYHSLTGLLAIHEAFGNGIRSEDLIPGHKAEREVHCEDSESLGQC